MYKNCVHKLVPIHSTLNGKSFSAVVQRISYSAFKVKLKLDMIEQTLAKKCLGEETQFVREFIDPC